MMIYDTASLAYLIQYRPYLWKKLLKSVNGEALEFKG